MEKPHNLIHQRDLLFNLIALKNTFLICQQECNNCFKKTDNWVVIHVCRHILCVPCQETSNNMCPNCKRKYNSCDVSTSTRMKQCYSKMETFAFKLIENEIENSINSEITGEISSTNNSSNESNVLINNGAKQDTPKNNVVLTSRNETELKIHSKTKNNNDNMFTDKVKENTPQLLSDSNHYVPQPSTCLLDVEMQTFAEESKSKEPSSNLSHVHLNPNKHEEMTIDSTQHNRDVEKTNSLENLQSNTSVVCDMKDIQIHDMNDIAMNSSPNSSHDSQSEDDIIEDSQSNSSVGVMKDTHIHDLNDKAMNNSLNSLNSSYYNQFEDGIIDGTPVKCNVLRHDSSISGVIEQPCEQIVLSYTYMNEDDIDVLTEFVNFFDIKLLNAWDDSVTHLVVKTNDSNKCVRTKKYIYAILSHCFIVSFNWVKECLFSKSLLTEIDYMPNDSSTGQPSALVSWRVGRSLIEPTMEWTKNCMLYFHDSVQTNTSCSDLIIYAKKAGFILADSMEEFNDEFKMRFIIVEHPFNDSSEDIMGWLYKYRAVTLCLEWFLECICQYKFVPINSRFQEIPLDLEMVQHSSMDESYFLLDR